MNASMHPYDTSASEASYDVVVVGASAGGLPALFKLATGLGEDFVLPIVAMLHLPPGAEPESVLQHLKLRIERLQSSKLIGTGTLWMCPPRSFVDLLPDDTVVVADNPEGAMGKPIDRLLASAARSFGSRTIAVILSGMGNDGSVGANELRAAGGHVLAQSPDSCEYADMPAAAIRIGATDLVVTLAELGDVLAELAQGAPRGRTRAELRAIIAAFGEQGDVALAARERDWQATPLGPALAWPEPFRALVREGVDSPHAVALWWGRQQVEVYNEAWSTFLGARHPAALGREARPNWDSEWERIDPLVEQVLNQGRPAGNLDLAMLVRRGGATEKVFANLSLAPLRDASGRVAGIRCMLWETTFDVAAQRRMRLLHELAVHQAEAATRHEACLAVVSALKTDRATVPFGLIYLLDPRGLQATLAAAAGLPAGSAAAPHLIHVASSKAAGWPLARVVGDHAAASADGEQPAGLLANRHARTQGACRADRPRATDRRHRQHVPQRDRGGRACAACRHRAQSSSSAGRQRDVGADRLQPACECLQIHLQRLDRRAGQGAAAACGTGGERYWYRYPERRDAKHLQALPPRAWRTGAYFGGRGYRPRAGARSGPSHGRPVDGAQRRRPGKHNNSHSGHRSFELAIRVARMRRRMSRCALPRRRSQSCYKMYWPPLRP